MDIQNTNNEGSYGNSDHNTDVIPNLYAADPASIIEEELDGDVEPEEEREVDLSGNDLGQDDPMLDAMRNHAHPLRP